MCFYQPGETKHNKEDDLVRTETPHGDLWWLVLMVAC
jgi:hypothetical protein